MKTKLMLLIFTLSFMVMAACAKDDGGEDPDPLPTWDGTAVVPDGIDGDDITLDTPEKLAWLAYAVNGTLPDGKGTATPAQNMEGKRFKLTTGVDMQNNEWPMIGTVKIKSGQSDYQDKKGFQGTFDGGGKTIENIKIDKAGEIGVGFFGYIERNATIKNIRIVSGKIKGGGYVGGVVGRGVGGLGATGGTAVDRITLERLSVGGGLTVTGPTVAGGSSTEDGDQPTGGVAGSVMNGDMKYCYNDGATVVGKNWVAGVIACLHNGTLKSSFNASPISGEDNIGGVTAHSLHDTGFPDDKIGADAKIFNIFNRGEISGKNNVGGVLALHYLGDISGSFNTATITSTTAKVVGQIVGAKDTPNTVTIGNKSANYVIEGVKAVGSGAQSTHVAVVTTATGDVLADMLNTQAGEDIWMAKDSTQIVLKNDFGW